MSYAVVRDAIFKRESLTAHYDNYVRYFSPHLIGYGTAGVPLVVGFQYGGGRRGGLSPSGEWCRFAIPDLLHVRVNRDKWQPGPHTGKPVEDLILIDIAA